MGKEEEEEEEEEESFLNLFFVLHDGSIDIRRCNLAVTQSSQARRGHPNKVLSWHGHLTKVLQ